LIGLPGLAGFFSKDAIIEAVSYSTIPGSSFAYFSVLAGVFITALYSFRLFFLVFHGKERFDAEGDHKPHESPAVVTVPLVLLAILSVIAGDFIGPILFGDFFATAIVVHPEHNVLAHVADEYHGIFAFMLHGMMMPAFWLAMLGIGFAYFLYMVRPDIPAKLQQRFSGLYRILENKYYFDAFNEKVFAGGSRMIGQFLWKVGDQTIIDGAVVNGTAKTVGAIAKIVRKVQTGYLYTYAFAMIIGLWLLLSYFVV